MKKKNFLKILLVVLLISISLFGYIKYKKSYSKKLVETSLSDDGSYILNIFMIGETDFPYGKTHCRFNLTRFSIEISELSFDIADDGANASENNFNITWNDEYVSIIVSGSEQEDVTYNLYFDGTTEILGE